MELRINRVRINHSWPVTSKVLVMKTVMLMVRVNRTSGLVCTCLFFQKRPLLPPATKLGQGYVFTTSLWFCSREVVSASVHAGIHTHTPQEQKPPRNRPPGAVHARRYGQQAGGTHATGIHTCCLALCPRKIFIDGVTSTVSMTLDPLVTTSSTMRQGSPRV